MKTRVKILAAAILLTVVMQGFGQTTDTVITVNQNVVETQVTLINEQLKAVQQQISKSESVNSVEMQTTVQKLIQENSTKNDPKIYGEIKALQDSIKNMQDRDAQLQSTLNGILEQVNLLKPLLRNKEDAERIENELRDANDELIIGQVGFFKGVLTAYSELTKTLNGIAETSRELLLFPEKENIWVTVGKYAGIIGGIVGPILISQSGKDLKTSGAITTGVSLSLTGIFNLVTKQKNKYVENIARNIAFTDEVNAFCMSSNLLTKNTKDFYDDMIKSFTSSSGKLQSDFSLDTKWKPNTGNLEKYLQTIYLRRDLSSVLRQMKAKAEYLLQDKDKLTDEGKKGLETLVQKYTEALISWESTESQYLNNHKILKEYIDKNNKSLNSK